MTKIQQAIHDLEATEVTLTWDIDASLSPKHVSLLTNGKGDDLSELLHEAAAAFEWEVVLAHRKGIAEEHGVPSEALQDHYPIVHHNFAQLIRNTDACIGVKLDIEHDALYQDYEDVEGELDELGINPGFNTIAPDWPHTPNRTDPLIAERDLRRLWLDACYHGVYVALLDASQVLEILWKGKTPTHLLAGSPVTIYDFLNGSGSTIVRTQRDVEIDASRIYHDDPLRYGILACYGRGMPWEGRVEARGPGDE
jgi:hypothetical protein